MDTKTKEIKPEKKPHKDLVGQKYNMLTVISFSHYSPTGYPQWECRCDCGNIKIVDEHNLLIGKTKSCGCLKSKRGKSLWKSTLTMYDGVQVESISAKVTKANNTSGFRGVSWVAKAGKWRVYLTFKGERHHLGYFEDFEDAVQARLQGEEMIDSFMEDYFNSVEEKSDEEKANLIRNAFENQIRAKERAESDFKRMVCKQKEYAFISSKMSILGGIKIDENLLVSGEVKGNIECAKSLMINGNVEGDVVADTVYIPNGKVIGNISANQIFCSNTRNQIFGNIVGTISPYVKIDHA